MQIVKCKSRRVLLVLFVGIMAGFVISTVLQNLVLNNMINDRKLSLFALQEHVHPRFANLDQQQTRPENLQDTDIMATNDEEKVKPEDETIEGDRESLSKKRSANMQHNEEETQAKDDNNRKNYETWRQGRNVQNIHTSSQQILKLSDELTSRQPLLIAIITSVQQLMSQTISIHSTWAKKAKRVIYFTGDVQKMPHLPHGMDIVQLEGIDDKQASWDIKEFAVVKYLTRHYVEDIDWFLVIGDDVFVNYEALKNKLEDFNASFQVYMGRPSDDSEHLKCNPATGVIYSRGLLIRIEPYLPQCQGEYQSLSQCIYNRGIHCTQAKEVS